MEIEYQYHFGLPRTVVWKYIKNDKVLRNALPGCKSFAQISTGVYLAEIQMNMGPIQDLFKLEIQLDGEKEPSSFRLKMKGNGNLDK
ncbi:SRPBCC domain-containing protein [Neobacillus cucumis]|uniref:SRPBCC domain-containing protein n=1 Tax=Neobacillus cucumis TaxID=1740721 RepID=UPI0015E09A9A|nr:SRPBCC domain-containing protein [Neobacillus cucumis]